MKTKSGFNQLRIALLLVVSLAINLFFQWSVHAEDKYYKGSFHCHTKLSDGTNTVDETAQIYIEAGYNFLGITDHERVSPMPSITADQFICIKAAEISVNPVHFVGVDIIRPVPDKQNYYTNQAIVDSITLQGGVPILAHPLYPTRLPVAAIAELRNIHHIEIFNNLTNKWGYRDDLSIWDSLLTMGRTFYGVASDDAHLIGDNCHAWIMVLTDKLEKERIVSAFNRGEFYSSTGITVNKLVFANNILEVETANADTIKFISEGRVQKTTADRNATFLGSGKYVRAEMSNVSGQRAWSQAFYPRNLNYAYLYGKDPNGQAASSTEIVRCYPNPFNGEITIESAFPGRSVLFLGIYDILGKLKETLYDGTLDSSVQKIHWRPNDAPSGIYFIEGQARLSDQKVIGIYQKLILVK